jgi:site-specific DNA-cytosine methylase
MDAPAHTGIGLYSGAGGVDRASHRPPSTCSWANDDDPFACETHRANIGDHLVCGDVQTISPAEGLEADTTVR